jgi:hypothetical protein
MAKECRISLMVPEQENPTTTTTTTTTITTTTRTGQSTLVHLPTSILLAL